jgi:hypothetical protein
MALRTSAADDQEARPMSEPTEPLRELLRGIIDYAGLFPPAGLPMDRAAQEHERASASAHGWMLGRFVVPLERLPELADAARARWEGPGAPWRLSVLVGEGGPEARERLEAFGAEHAPRSGRAGAAIESLELKTAGPEAVAEAALHLPEGVEAYFELPLDQHPNAWLLALRSARVRAKVRTGGVRPEMIPSAAELGRFLLCAAELRVPFKATAGLHHPVRAEHPLTYEPGSVRGRMHGFLNVFLASALAWHGRLGAAEATELLEETDWAAFSLGKDAIRWRDRELSCAELAESRARFALSYGSCSFREPVEDLQARGWL